MNCTHCNKWAGPHAVLPGQDDSILCKCSMTDKLYNELLFAVGNKYPQESRHQTALRYIRQAETCDSQLAKANIGAKP